MLRFFFFVKLGLILVALIVAASQCALAPSPEMKALIWLPRSVAYWADLQPTFRNFPAFGAISLIAVFFVHFGFHSLNWGRAVFVTLLVSVFSIILEVMQLMIPSRFFDLADIGWSIAGACVGSLFGILAIRFLTILFFSRNQLPSEKTLISAGQGAFGECRQTRRC